MSREHCEYVVWFCYLQFKEKHLAAIMKLVFKDSDFKSMLSEMFSSVLESGILAINRHNDNMTAEKAANLKSC